MSDPRSYVLCSGSLGSISLDEKFRAAAAAGFGWVSVYGDEYRAAVAAGLDCLALLRELDLQVAEVDGVAVTMQSDEAFADALNIALAVEARSITIVETSDYDPGNATEVKAAVDAFGRHCDLADQHGILVHIEPYAWSTLSRTGDCATIINGASRSNGGLLLDLWHLVRGPDQGHLAPDLDPAAIFEVQLADTLAQPWVNIRDECMDHRQMPGHGHGDLARRLGDLAAKAPLPLMGIELFGEATADPSATEMAAICRTALERVVADAGI